MLRHAQPLSAYEEHLNTQDMKYLANALDPKLRGLE